jgi:1-deoxy-D-xylulose-5-phosphate reductoisomerase
MKSLSILGSTGSIGTQTLEIIKQFPEKFNLIGISAGKNVTLLKQQIEIFKPKYASVLSNEHAKECEVFVKNKNISTQIVVGEDGLNYIASKKQDLLIVAIVGTASLKPAYEGIMAGTTIGLACKEILVAAGDFFTSLAKEKNVDILPIDSEHAALKQCLAGINENNKQYNKLILTASGGPFWNTPKEDFSKITLEKALNHPNWSMGNKITIDSATMMNKGLEVIEAHHLYQTPYDKIDVIIHPQSIIHSMVEFTDGTVLSQMGLPDMRFPIQYVLTYPEKIENPWPKMDLTKVQPLNFYAPDFDKFPLLKCAYDCGKKGGSYPVVMNAANESAVALFLNKKISFSDIYKTVDNCISKTNHQSDLSLQDIISLDLEIKQSVLRHAQ